MASWSRALSHERSTVAGDALLPHLPQLVEAMLSYLQQESSDDHNKEDAAQLAILQRDAELALHMMTTSNERAIKVIEGFPTVNVLAEYLKRHDTTTLSASIALGQLVARESDSTRIGHIVVDSGVCDTIVHALQELMAGKILGMYTLGGLIIASACLAVNDNNKRLLHEAGFIDKVLVRILKGDHQTKSYDPVRTKYLAAEAVWNLAFLKDLHPPLLEAGVVPLLEEMKQSGEEKSMYYASGALFELGEKEEHIRHAHDHENDDDDPQQQHSHDNMVMLSYNWGVQETVVRIKHELEAAGFTVWLDLEKMSGSTLGAMAQAVEDSAVIITCVSRKYQESAACRTEAEYAYVLQKNVVPCMFEPQPWRASGWLGAQLGAALWYDFSDEEKFQISMTNLIKALNQHVTTVATTTTKKPAPSPSATTSDSATTTTSAPVVSAAPPKSKATEVAAMDQAAVQFWVKKIGLPETVRLAFDKQSVTGRSLLELHHLQQSNTEFYYRLLAHCCCQEDMSQSTGLLLAFSVHLRELLEKGPPPSSKV